MLLSNGGVVAQNQDSTLKLDDSFASDLRVESGTRFLVKNSHKRPDEMSTRSDTVCSNTS